MIEYPTDAVARHTVAWVPRHTRTQRGFERQYKFYSNDRKAHCTVLGPALIYCCMPSFTRYITPLGSHEKSDLLQYVLVARRTLSNGSDSPDNPICINMHTVHLYSMKLPLMSIISPRPVES